MEKKQTIYPIQLCELEARSIRAEARKILDSGRKLSQTPDMRDYLRSLARTDAREHKMSDPEFRNGGRRVRGSRSTSIAGYFRNIDKFR